MSSGISVVTNRWGSHGGGKMASFNPDSYEMVEERIKRFYEDHPNGKITTELLSDPNTETFAMFKAYVWVDFETMVSTGHAQEQAGQSNPVNRTSHLENCETSAIGRALANYKYSGKKRPSREEMAKTSTPTKPKETMKDKPEEDLFQKITSYCRANPGKFPEGIGKTMNLALDLRTKGQEKELKELWEKINA